MADTQVPETVVTVHVPDQSAEAEPLVAQPPQDTQEQLPPAEEIKRMGSTTGYGIRNSAGELKEPRKDYGITKNYHASESISNLNADGEDKAPDRGVADFVYNEHGLTEDEAKEIFDRVGPNELPDRRVPDWKIIGISLVQPMPLMIWAASIIEAAIQNWIDMGILLFIQFANCSIGFYETKKAGNAVDALKKSLRPKATVKRRKTREEEGKFQLMDASMVVPGDCVLLASGANIPADCRINHGTIDVDQSTLTGESLPVTMVAMLDDPKAPKPKMGSTCVKGEVEATVEFTGEDTELGQAAKLLQGRKERSNMEKKLMQIMMVLLVVSTILCAIVLIFLLVNGETVTSALSFTVVLMVASIPLAIEIVCTTTLAVGSRTLSKDGAIVKRLTAIEAMAAMNLLCSDKTGTLTQNKMTLCEETPVYMEGESRDTVLRYGAMAAKWKEPARDALDKLVLGEREGDDHHLVNPNQKCADLESLKNVVQIDYLPFDAKIKRTEGTVRDGDSEFKVTKGAPQIIAKLLRNQEVAERVNADVHALGKRGIRSLAVARTYNLDADAEWHMLGLLSFLDPPRHDTKITLETAAKYGVPCKMITGDHILIAKETARQLGMGENILGRENLPEMAGENKDKEPKDLVSKYGTMIRDADGFAEVFPHHKFLIVAAFRRMGYKTGMTGDGVNDAPALKKGDVGIAVEGATDAARAAADIVLTKPGLSTIIGGMQVARQIFQRMQNFLTYRIAATMQLLVFFFIAVLSFRPHELLGTVPPEVNVDEWQPFFKMPVLLLMLITLLNDGTLIAIGYDNVETSQYPEEWNLPVRFFISCTLALVALGSSLLILWGALTSWVPGSWFQVLKITEPGKGLQYGEVTCMIYLKVALSDFLTLFSCRTGERFFWTRLPSPVLLVAAMIALLSSSSLALSCPTGNWMTKLSLALGSTPSTCGFIASFGF